MAIRIGIDVACRASHRAACADATGQLLWRNVCFQTRAEDLDDLWQRIPQAESDITVVMEPTRNAWVPLAAWFRRHGARVVMVPPEQSADCGLTTTSTPRPIGSMPSCWPDCRP